VRCCRKPEGTSRQRGTSSQHRLVLRLLNRGVVPDQAFSLPVTTTNRMSPLRRDHRQHSSLRNFHVRVALTALFSVVLASPASATPIAIVRRLDRECASFGRSARVTAPCVQGETDESLKTALRNLLAPMSEYRKAHQHYPLQLADLVGYRPPEGAVIRLYVDSAFWSATVTSSRAAGITCAIRFGIDDDAMAGVAWCEPTVVRAAAGPVRIALRNLIVAMETYWAEHHHYPLTLAPMTNYYAPGPSIAIVLSNVSDNGWTATGTTSKMPGLICRLVLPPPADSRTGDEPQCAAPRP
jgi:hypothetical protein